MKNIYKSLFFCLQLMATLSFGTPASEWDKASFLLKEAQKVKEEASLKGQAAEEIRETLQQ